MATLQDIAAEAGVSAKTVSNILNGRTQGLTAATAERVMRVREIAEQLKYRPNLAARTMRTSRSQQIGVLVSELTNPATGQLVELLEAEASRRGYRLLLGLTIGREGQIDRYLDEFASGLVDGVINCEPALSTHRLRERVGNVPAISYCRGEPESRVELDAGAGIQAGLKHLWGLGHRRIGLVSVATSDVGVELRRLGYRSFYQERGGAPQPDWVMYVSPDGRITDPEVLKPMITSGCTAAVTVNDVVAVNVLRALRRLGHSIPEDFSVVGFDDSPIAELAEPPLTTLRLPKEQMAVDTVSAVLDLIEGKPCPPLKTYVPDLIIRESTAGLRDELDPRSVLRTQRRYDSNSA